MRPRSHLAAPAVLLAASLQPTALAQPAAPNYAQERAERATELTAPFGWFSLVALQYLKPGATTVGSAPGNTLVLAGAPPHLLTVSQTAGKVTLTAADPSLRLGSQPPHLSAVLAGEEDPDALAAGTLRLWAIDRGGQRFLRVKDSNAPARLHFHGLRWYAPDPRLRITARWIPYTTPHTLLTHNQIGQASTQSVPGYLEFDLNGTHHTLTPISSGEKDGLFFVFRDQTYLEDTDGGGRFLSTDPPSAGLHHPGTVVLDFNQAVNPPCAFTPFATCPLAAPENRLPVRIPAGEKRYED